MGLEGLADRGRDRRSGARTASNRQGSGEGWFGSSPERLPVVLRFAVLGAGAGFALTSVFMTGRGEEAGD